MNIIKDYFFDCMNRKEKKEENEKQIINKEENRDNIIIIENDNINDELNISSNSLMVERQKHICPEKI